MEDCDYCSETFEDEEAYLRHLRDQHEGELGRIDRQRVEQLDDDEGPSNKVLYGAVVALGVLIAAIAYTTFAGGGGGADPEGIEAEPLPDNGDQALLEDVQHFEEQSRNHVSRGTDVDYDHVPPTSGPHYDGWVQPGFYEETKSYEKLVHNLEHGHVVIYYDPAQLSDEAEESLRQFAAANDDNWAAVVAVPHPEENPEAAYTMTAWTKKLTMDEYDPEAVRAFLAEYIGRGPENPVR
ncbi:hypothetical protein BRC81_08675 [Halobacteriales archaeon QS_1_68_20]|nr:MAG: hypothetical protein BRC81_08675 [Halobacteriales archaeon QS_1_68_20]